MNQTTSVEQAVLQGIARRLEVSAGRCTISVRALAKSAARATGLIEEGYPPRWVYDLTDRLLQEKEGKFWGHSAIRVGKKKLGTNSTQSNIYIFGNGCKTCGDSNQVKTPHETFCSTCGNNGGAA